MIRRLAVIVLATSALTTACRDAAERRAAELAELRGRAATGLAAAQRYCAERATVLTAAARGEPGLDRALDELLLAPHALDDFCEGGDHAEPEADGSGIGH